MFAENEGRKTARYVADETHSRALEFIRRHHERPFFAYLPYIIPHVELIVPEDSETPYRGKFPRVSIQDPRSGYRGSEDGLTTFAGMVSRLDRQVGEVLVLLKELDIDERTIVFFTSDNGAQGSNWAAMNDFFGSTGELRGYKGTFYEGGLRVPLLVRWPGHVEAGGRTDHVCGFQDMLPTLCELAGGEAPSEIDGLSLVPTLTGQGRQVAHTGLYWEYSRRDRGLGRAARMGRWKAVQPKPEQPVELYDLASDPGEATDIAKQHPTIVREVTAWMDGAHASPRPPAGPPRKTGVADYVR